VTSELDISQSGPPADRFPAVTEAEINAAREAIRDMRANGCGFNEAAYHLMNRHALTPERAAGLIAFSEFVAGEQLDRP
jgi:hypothetical protein